MGDRKLLFKQLKQNFPLRYFYGESANAIKNQIWITLIANLLLMVIQKTHKTPMELFWIDNHAKTYARVLCEWLYIP